MTNNCHQCSFKGEIPGSAHISCNNEKASLLDLIDVLKGTQNISKLEITYDPEAVKKGYFLWPIDFDPIWLKKCQGFTEKSA